MLTAERKEAPGCLEDRKRCEQKVRGFSPGEDPGWKERREPRKYWRGTEPCLGGKPARGRAERETLKDAWVIEKSCGRVDDSSEGTPERGRQLAQCAQHRFPEMS